MFKNVLFALLALIAGLLVGALINGGIIIGGSKILTPPEGVDPMDIETIKANIHKYTFVDYLVPFLAHALGTLFGVVLAMRITKAWHVPIAMVIAALFLWGGWDTAKSLGDPQPFTTIDLLGAYFPMAFIGIKIGRKIAE